MSKATAKEPPYHHLTPNELSEKSTPNPRVTHQKISKLLDTKCTTSLELLKQTHALAIKNGSARENFIAGSLVKCYSNSDFNSFSIAVKVFDQLPHPHAFLWNSIIKGFVGNNELYKALSFYYKMVVSQTMPNQFTFPPLFKACSVAGAIEEGIQLHAHVVKHGLGRDGHIRSSAIKMYSACGHLKEARQMLDEGMETGDVVCWNAMLDGYLKNCDIGAATELFESMVDKNIGSWNAMITGYARCGRIELAEKLFHEMPERDEISWSAMIDGYINQCCFKKALEIFREMQRQGIQLRKTVFSSVLAACANVGALDEGRWIHAYMKKNLIEMDAIVGTSLVDMYAKCGRLDMAWEVFEDMKHKRVFLWNAMIGGLAMHGRAEDAIELFLKMQRDQMLRPDEISFVGVLNACAHAGLVEEGLQFFNSMKQRYGIEPTVEHYGCVVDMLGRAGHFEMAQAVIESMPMKPNAAIWGALLGACRIHGNMELGEKVGKILLKLEPQNSGRYALLSQIYAKAGRWDDVANVRKLMKERHVKSKPGSSIINLNGVVHEFVMGEALHPQMNEIEMMLDEIIAKLRSEGYVPNTSQVLSDVDEEEKETALCYHSEKLAIAFGLLNTAPGITIRIVKNLRVCEDCHMATKLISRVYDRDIIVRDRVRYHQFSKGSCSCKDFW